MTSPDDFLYRCDYCESWWTGNSRFSNPATADDAEARFPGKSVAASLPVDDSQLSEAVALFTGWGTSPEPIDDMKRVVARFPARFTALEAVLSAFIRGSASIAFHEVAPADEELLKRVRERLGAIMPRLSMEALDARTWRWRFVVQQTSPF